LVENLDFSYPITTAGEIYCEYIRAGLSGGVTRFCKESCVTHSSRALQTDRQTEMRFHWRTFYYLTV